MSDEFVCGPIMVRLNILARSGDSVPPHRHNFAHASVGIEGLMLVRLSYSDGRCQEIHKLNPGVFINIPAEAEHEIIALVDNCRFACLFPHRNAQGQVVETAADWHPGYY